MRNTRIRGRRKWTRYRRQVESRRQRYDARRQLAVSVVDRWIEGEGRGAWAAPVGLDAPGKLAKQADAVVRSVADWDANANRIYTSGFSCRASAKRYRNRW